MAILTKSNKWKKQVIDLTGPQGNAFYLLGLASKLCKQVGIEHDGFIIDDMKNGDYEHLITRFDYHFGHLVDLER